MNRDISVLRELAKKTMEAANDPIMDERRTLWADFHSMRSRGRFETSFGRKTAASGAFVRLVCRNTAGIPAFLPDQMHRNLQLSPPKAGLKTPPSVNTP